MEYHHRKILHRGTLIKALRFIDQRLETGTQITDVIIGYTKGQCEKDSGGRIRFR